MIRLITIPLYILCVLALVAAIAFGFISYFTYNLAGELED